MKIQSQEVENGMLYIRMRVVYEDIVANNQNAQCSSHVNCNTDDIVVFTFLKYNVVLYI